MGPLRDVPGGRRPTGARPCLAPGAPHTSLVRTSLAGTGARVTPPSGGGQRQALRRRPYHGPSRRPGCPCLRRRDAAVARPRARHGRRARGARPTPAFAPHAPPRRGSRAERRLLRHASHNGLGEAGRWRRIRVLRTLARVNHPACRTLLPAALEDGDVEVAGAAVRSLGDVGAPWAVEEPPRPCARTSTTGPAWLRSSSAWRRCRGRCSCRCSTSADAGVRFWAATLLAPYPTLATPALVARTADADANVRAAAVETLAGRKGKRPLAAALRSLDDPEWFVRCPRGARGGAARCSRRRRPGRAAARRRALVGPLRCEGRSALAGPRRGGRVAADVGRRRRIRAERRGRGAAGRRRPRRARPRGGLGSSRADPRCGRGSLAAASAERARRRLSLGSCRIPAGASLVTLETTLRLCVVACGAYLVFLYGIRLAHARGARRDAATTARARRRRPRAACGVAVRTR